MNPTIRPNTPAESTAYRFATLDKEQFGDKAILQGDNGANYYTNSSHVPVNSDISFADKVKIEGKYHSLTPGGHIFHAFMGESYSDPDALMSLTNKIASSEDQIIELKVQDIVVSDNCGEYLVGVANFVDDLLERYYGMERFYNVKDKYDLIGHLIAGLAPHTSAGVLGRIVG